MTDPLGHLDDTERDCVRRFLAILADRLGDDLVEVRLFGSAARGEMWSERSAFHSDIDLLVLTRQELPSEVQDELINETYPLYLECGRQIGPQWRTIDWWLAPPDEPARTFVANVEREGRTILSGRAATSRWGPEGPPPEAYSRVTNPERFAPLHDAARELLSLLESEFDVERSDVDEPDDVYSGSANRPTVMLRPPDPDCSPLFVTITDFPGVLVRFGWHGRDSYPSCGCDACDESAAGESRRMRANVRNLVTGRYAERLELPLIGSAHIVRAADRSWSRSLISRAEAKRLRAAGRGSRDWKPWPRRAEN